MSPTPQPREFFRPRELLAGFVAVHPEPGLAELVMVGEQWGHGGQCIPEHRHDVWEFYYQVSGESWWRGAGKTWKLSAGSLLAMPPGVSHWMARPQADEHHYYFAGIHPAAVRKRNPEMPDVFGGCSPWMCRHAHSVAPAFAALVREVSLIRPARQLGLQLAVDSLMLEVARAVETRPGAQVLPWHPGVERAIGIIRQNPGQTLTVASLARLAGVSTGHFTELFKCHLGTTPHRFVLQTRLDRARELVESSNLPLTRMALELGFASSQHLSGAFREAFGCSPRIWRRDQSQYGKSARRAGQARPRRG